MLRPRIIPCLLVHNKGLVKTVNFGQPKYVGDPVNAVRIFNEKEVDELIVLDIDATAQRREPDYALIRNLAAECRMPLAYGGGVKTVEQVVRIIKLGVEKVAVSSLALETPAVISEMARYVGSQSIVAVLDVKRDKSGRYQVWTHNGTRNTKRDPIDVARELEQRGVGEITVNSIDRDGVMQGYDLDLARRVRDAVTVPMTVLGGAGRLADIGSLIGELGIVGAAAGSLFVFKGVYKAVLINYPNRAEKDAIASAALGGTRAGLPEAPPPKTAARAHA
ncbi:MAG TPA: AglZ/HisF2 family acetamidino modification protein [Gemmatimonadaceae bacterium]|nr:AglZ/HisF2 family acetamidino modification protein [Gemmatimonadaceae bacterium]